MMNRFHALLLILCLLCGCASSPAAEYCTGTVPQTEPQNIPGLYDPGSALEAQTNGALRCYPLGGSGECALLSLEGERLLLVSSGSEATTLTMLEGEFLSPGACIQLPFYLPPSAPSLQPCSSGISYYDPQGRQTVVLDSALQELRRINIPEDALWEPLLAHNADILYYCTQDSIRGLEVSSGISRVVKHSSHAQQMLTDLSSDGSAIVCQITDESGLHTLLLSAQTGATLYSSPGEASIISRNGTLFAVQEDASLFGAPGATMQTLVTADPAEEVFFLGRQNMAVTRSLQYSDAVVMNCYELHSGRRTASLMLDGTSLPWSIQPAGDEGIWFIRYDPGYGCNTLFLWTPSRSPVFDTAVYTAPYFTRENPDLNGLAECAAYAQELESRYGIEILIYQDADNVQPAGYRLEYAYQAPALLRTLTLLEQCFQHYPEGFLSTVTARFDGVTICLVHSIQGSVQWGTLEQVNGLQFWDGHHAYIALTVGSSAEGAFYHQFCHLIDTIVLNESSAYDTWQSLNPSGFHYDYSYINNLTRDSTAYLQGANRYFADMFSMSFPKEDRARIMEYAMLPGNEALFQSKPMQAKLLKLCLGIREAFGLESSPQDYLWEQYLTESLACRE